MPWLVSMRMSGHVIGARATTATRRSVIFKSEGLELVLVFCGRASRVSSAQKPAASAPAPFRKERRPARLDGFMMDSPDCDTMSPPQAHRRRGRTAPLLAQGGKIE